MIDKSGNFIHLEYINNLKKHKSNHLPGVAVAADVVAEVAGSVLLDTVCRSLARPELLLVVVLFCCSLGDCVRSDLAGSGFSGWNSSLISWRSLLVSFSLVRSCSMFCNASGSSGVTKVFGLTKKFLLLLGFGLVICVE